MIRSLLKGLKSGLDTEQLEWCPSQCACVARSKTVCSIHDDRAKDREAVVNNVRHQLQMLAKDEDIMAKASISPFRMGNFTHVCRYAAKN